MRAPVSLGREYGPLGALSDETVAERHQELAGFHGHLRGHDVIARAVMAAVVGSGHR